MLYGLLASTNNSCFANYPDDTTPYVISNNPKEVVSDLRDINEKLFTWFSLNKEKASLGKGHIILNSTKLPNFQTPERVNNYHLSAICQTANRIKIFMKFIKRRIVMNAFFHSQFDSIHLDIQQSY